ILDQNAKTRSMPETPSGASVAPQVEAIDPDTSGDQVVRAIPVESDVLAEVVDEDEGGPVGERRMPALDIDRGAEMIDWQRSHHFLYVALARLGGRRLIFILFGHVSLLRRV